VTVDDWLALDRRGLAAALAQGHPIAPDALDDSRYVGLSLGLPGWVDRLAWKIFEKDFYRDPATGALRGWNVRLTQRAWQDDPEPLLKGGEPITFGHYGVAPDPGTRRPAVVPGGLLLDYGAGANPWWDPVRRVRDPLVAVKPGSTEVLLGWTWVDLGLGTWGTPSYFLLRRHGPLDRVPDPVSSTPGLDP